MISTDTARTNTRNLPLQYAGYFWLKRADLAITPNRAYHPKLKRWISKDPIGEQGGDNLYRYVNNNPVNLIDDSGLVPRDPQRCYEATGRTTDLVIDYMTQMHASGVAVERALGMSAAQLRALPQHQLVPMLTALHRNPHVVGQQQRAARALAALERNVQDVRTYCGDDNDDGPPTNMNNPNSYAQVAVWGSSRLPSTNHDLNRGALTSDGRHGTGIMPFADPLENAMYAENSPRVLHMGRYGHPAQATAAVVGPLVGVVAGEAAVATAASGAGLWSSIVGGLQEFVWAVRVFAL